MSDGRINAHRGTRRLGESEALAQPLVQYRRAVMGEMRDDGMTLAEIGARYGVSRERVWQIIHGR